MTNRNPIPSQTTQPPDTNDPPENQPVILVGIDWADRQHEFALTGPDGKLHTGSIDQKPDSIAEFLNQWRNKIGVRHIVMSIETTNGTFINALMEHSGITILPVNPSALASYREAFAHGGGKNDQVDARLVLQYLTHYRDPLRPLQIGSPQTRTLTALVRDRREFVQLRMCQLCLP